MNYVPCKDCRERSETCHAICKRYQEYNTENERIKMERKKAEENRSLLFRPKNYK